MAACLLAFVRFLHPLEIQRQHLLASFHVCVSEHVAETTDA